MTGTMADMTIRRLVTTLAVLGASVLVADAQPVVTDTWRADGVGKAPWTVALTFDGGRLTGRVSSCTSLPVDIYDGSVATRSTEPDRG